MDDAMKHLLSLGLDYTTILRYCRRGMFKAALEKTNGNKSAAARALGIHRNVLEYQMKVLEER